MSKPEVIQVSFNDILSQSIKNIKNKMDSLVSSRSNSFFNWIYI